MDEDNLFFLDKCPFNQRNFSDIPKASFNNYYYYYFKYASFVNANAIFFKFYVS